MNPNEVLGRVGGNRELLRELVELFLEEYPLCLGEIRDGLSRGDLNGVRQAAHLLSGSVGNFGITAAYEAARRLEACARAGDPAGAAAAWPTLEEELRWFVADLRGLAARLPCDSATTPGMNSRPEEMLT